MRNFRQRHRQPNGPLAARRGSGAPLAYPDGVFRNGTTGQCIQTADKAQLDITGDIDIAVHINPTTWKPTGDKGLVGKWLSTTNKRGFAFHSSTSGVLKLYWSTAGTATVGGTSTLAVPFSDGTAGWVRTTLDVNNGSGGHDLKFYTAASDPAFPSSWTQLGTTVVNAAGAGTTSIFANDEPLNIGQGQTNTGPNQPGYYLRVVIKNGIDGTVVADFNASLSGATGYTDAYGNTWTIS